MITGRRISATYGDQLISVEAYANDGRIIITINGISCNFPLEGSFNENVTDFFTAFKEIGEVL
jgi:hypothetical protein